MLRYQILILFCWPLLLTAQPGAVGGGISPKDSLSVPMHMIAQNYGDSIVVRWAPGSGSLWLLSQTEGFNFKRKIFSRNERSEFIIVDSASFKIRPWPIERWGAEFKSSHDTLLAMAAEVIYGKTTAFNTGKDGNSMNTILEKYDEQQSRFGFALLISDFDPQVANGMGFRFVDRQIDKNLYYLYSVTPAEKWSELKADTGRVLVRGSDVYTRKPFPELSQISGDRVVHLFWPSVSLENKYTAYIIERSTDGHRFERLNRLPYISIGKDSGKRKPVRYDDSLAVNYKTYFYRVSGVNAFGDVSLPSPVISAMGVDLRPPVPPLITSIHNHGPEGSIVLEWEKSSQESDFRGYIVGRGDNLEGPFQPLTQSLLPFGTNTFTDQNPNTTAPNYYIVAALDTSGNPGRSMPAYMNADDKEPPMQPIGLTGKIDSSGHVTIRWNWNKESDLSGYRIYFSNSSQHIFVPASGIMLTDTLFTDSISLKTLTKKIYYKVIAYDRNKNASPASDILILTRPDLIPPVPPILHHFEVSDTAVYLKWYPSASEDVEIQKLFRKSGENPIWTLLQSFSPADTLYNDLTVESGIRYTYAVESIDSSGLSSGKSFPLNVYVYTNGTSDKISNFRIDKTDSVALLTWSPPDRIVRFYILYKEINNTGLRMAGNIPGTVTRFTEPLDKGNYKYALMAIFENGSKSSISEIKTLLVE